MTIYKLRPKPLKENEPKEGDEKTEGDYNYKFINGEWRLIYYKDSKGFEYWKDYDEKGNGVHYKDSDGDEYWYDENGDNISKEEFDRIWEEKK